MWAFTYRHLHFLYSLRSQTKAYLCPLLGNLPWSFQGLFNLHEPLHCPTLASTTCASQLPVCVSPQRPAPGFLVLPARLNSCSLHPPFRPTLSFFHFACYTCHFPPFVLCFADVFRNQTVRKRLDLKCSPPEAFYALAWFSPNWIKAIMRVREELYKHCFNRCSYSAVRQWKNVSWWPQCTRSCIRFQDKLTLSVVDPSSSLLPADLLTNKNILHVL